MQVLITGYKTYSNARYTIYYDNKMCHMVFDFDYGTTSFPVRDDWSDFSVAAVPTTPDNLTPEQFVNIPTTRANFYHLIRPTGIIAWKNKSTGTMSDVGPVKFTVSWKRR